LKTGTLYLIPVTLGDNNVAHVLPSHVIEKARQLEFFVVENEKTARQFLGVIKTIRSIRELTLTSLNEHTPENQLPSLLVPLLEGKDMGLMSEAGCPGIADPGAALVKLAHKKGIKVVPLVGPSSILLALIASGMNGQGFTFLGYLPTEKTERIQCLKEIEKKSRQGQQTQIFIETPYRNQHLLADILSNCQPETQLCIACDITLDEEFILTRRIAEWKKSDLPDLNKRPTVFLLQG
jgi:16S rRNA (cytidine1402-2'-O)-methyltransferase